MRNRKAASAAERRTGQGQAEGAQGGYLADVSLEPLHTEGADDEPQLEGTEPSAQCYLPVLTTSSSSSSLSSLSCSHTNIVINTQTLLIHQQRQQHSILLTFPQQHQISNSADTISTSSSTLLIQHQHSIHLTLQQDQHSNTALTPTDIIISNAQYC